MEQGIHERTASQGGHCNGILSANGNQGSGTVLLAELKKDHTTSVVLKRAKCFQVRIVRDNKELSICLLDGAEKLSQLQG